MSNLFLFNSKKFDSPDDANKAGELHVGAQYFDAIESYINGEGDNFKIEVEESINLALRCADQEPLDFSLAVMNANDSSKFMLLDEVNLEDDALMSNSM
jgi:hypothetical protein